MGSRGRKGACQSPRELRRIHAPAWCVATWRAGPAFVPVCPASTELFRDSCTTTQALYFHPQTYFSSRQVKPSPKPCASPAPEDLRFPTLRHGATRARANTLRSHFHTDYKVRKSQSMPTVSRRLAKRCVNQAALLTRALAVISILPRQVYTLPQRAMGRHRLTPAHLRASNRVRARMVYWYVSGNPPIGGFDWSSTDFPPVAYSLGIYLLNLFLAFLSPKFDPSIEQDEGMEDGAAGGLPTKESQEFRPFVRRLPEFKFWHSSTRAIGIAFLCSWSSLFDIPVFWPVLVVYWLILFVLTSE